MELRNFFPGEDDERASRPSSTTLSLHYIFYTHHVTLIKPFFLLYTIFICLRKQYVDKSNTIQLHVSCRKMVVGVGVPPESQEPGTDYKMTETSLALCYTSIIYYLFDGIFDYYDYIPSNDRGVMNNRLEKTGKEAVTT